jgi:hypothetical protein
MGEGQSVDMFIISIDAHLNEQFKLTSFISDTTKILTFGLLIFPFLAPFMPLDPGKQTI